jgi:carboxyl-terminal processing protease
MRLVLLVTTTLALALPAPAASTPDATARRLATFQTVWTIVNEKFYDPEFNGVDWAAVRARYRPRVEAAESEVAFYTLLNSMLGELHSSHFALIPPESVVASDASADHADDRFGGDVGLTVRLVGDQAVATEVDPEGPAWRAGVRPGALMVRIGTAALAGELARIAGAPLRKVQQSFRARRLMDSMLAGAPGAVVEIEYVDASGTRNTAQIRRRPRPGKPTALGELRGVLTNFTARRLDGNVGYLRFNVFMPVLMDDIRAAVRSFSDCAGVILDLRGNTGGVAQMAPAIAGLFCTERSSLGTMKMRRGEMHLICFPQPEALNVPLVILTDEASASTSELLAGGMQENGRALICGEPTLGAVLPSLVERLAGGAVLQYAIADFKTPKGVLLEGRGVVPDLPVSPRREDYYDGRDPVLERALQHLAARRESAEAR